MGCICVKGTKAQEPNEVQQDKEPGKSSKSFFASSRREGVAVADADAVAVTKSRGNGDGTSGTGNKGEPHLAVVGVPKAFVAEHVAAGWPSWLTSVAAEAVKGWLPRQAESFEKLNKIGQGTYSNVYKARDLETGKTVALKKVRFINMDPESVRFMAREIIILRRLDHPNVLKLEGLVTSRMSCSLYLVFEYMEHDLAGLAAAPGIKFSEPQVKCYMKQLLCGLDHCHSQGVLHRDIKGSNLLVDDNGILRIGDFGLATFFNPNEKQQMTSRVVTLWYRPPELLLGATEYSVGVDLWSAGCILAELFAGKPVMPGRTEVEQMHKIYKLCGSPTEEYWSNSKLPHATIFKPQHPYQRCLRHTFKDFPASALALLDNLLAIEPADRGTAASALKSTFFSTKPLPCDPSSLPKYPPSKELDAKLREAARRQRKALRAQAESKATNVGNAAGESQKAQGQEDVGTADSSFSRTTCPGLPGNHKTVPGRSSTTLGRSNALQLKAQRSCRPQEEGTDFADFARPGTTKYTGKSNNRKDTTKHAHRPSNRYNQLDVADASNHVLDRPASTHKKDIGVKDTAMGYGAKKKRIHYSGPLMPSGGNVEEMLREHERQIQQAVRKARLDKDKTKKHAAQQSVIEPTSPL